MLKKETKRKILSTIVPPIGSFLFKLIYLTCKARFHGSKLPKTNSIYVYWHGEIITLPLCYKNMQEKNQKTFIITSLHFDGQLMHKTLSKIHKLYMIKGSSYKGGVKALIGAIRVLKQKNNNVGIALDGPRGPRHSVANGAVILSQKINIPIVAVNSNVSSFWQFNSWDKMVLPKPFSTIDFYISKPFLLNGLSLEEGKQKIKEKLMKHTQI